MSELTIPTAEQPNGDQASALTVAYVPVLESGQVTTAHGTRDYLFLRPGPTPDPVPLVLVFHGGGGNAQKAANQFGFTSLTSAPPFLTVFPQGTSVTTPPDPVRGVWKSGHSYNGSQLPADVDDVDFFDQLLIEVTRRTANAGLRIDQSRTYACGFSNGGMMTYRLAAERSHELAAVAVVCSSLGGVADSVNAPGEVHVNDPVLHGAEPVALFHLHGLLDEGVSFYGGQGGKASANPRADLPTIDAMELWAAHNGCRPTPRIEATENGMMRTWTDGDSDTEVQLLTMPGLGHQIPDFFLDLVLPFFDAHTK